MSNSVIFSIVATIFIMITGLHIYVRLWFFIDNIVGPEKFVLGFKYKTKELKNGDISICKELLKGKKIIYKFLKKLIVILLFHDLIIVSIAILLNVLGFVLSKNDVSFLLNYFNLVLYLIPFFWLIWDFKRLIQLYHYSKQVDKYVKNNLVNKKEINIFDKEETNRVNEKYKNITELKIWTDRLTLKIKGSKNKIELLPFFQRQFEKKKLKPFIKEIYFWLIPQNWKEWEFYSTQEFEQNDLIYLSEHLEKVKWSKEK
ncbi:hypothetical protein MCSF7_02266 [Mycoplasmopsis columbina SF7]|uniref:Uncharacterized protein n=1 Tax=Mycoplasmopsis columbina SF7 TaxID=1037410 RepID=F9UKP0_9BACT|nr:hypothetical protein [Mycoplasmopsis columbina]EGV00245.1 hypothetical protein MCSF7_02266 [Mycoplasmopsis columbina SF7]